MASPSDEDSDLESTSLEFDQAHAPSRPRPVASPAPADVDLTTVSVLRALVAASGDEDALIVAVDDRGFPLAQTRVARPVDLPRAVVVGRHHRCDLVVRSDTELSLRHFLFVVLQSRGDLRIRCIDLRRRAESLNDLGSGPPEPGTSLCAVGYLWRRVGSSQLFLLPGGALGLELLSGDASSVLESLRNNPTIDPSAGFRPRSITGSHARPLGGYRQDLRQGPRNRGILRLRGQSDEMGRVPHRDVELRPQSLQHGLLIGRHAERCTLAGEARNLSRMHALVCEEDEHSLLVFDLASTNGVRPKDQVQGPSHSVVRVYPGQGCLLGQFHLDWLPNTRKHG